MTPAEAEAGGPRRPSASSLPSIPGYEVLGRLGAGGSGEVYKARHLALDRAVAIKVLRRDFLEGRTAGRLRREARLAARLDHEGIVRGLDLGEIDGRPYFVMEFVEGRSLKTVLRERGALPEAEVIEIGAQIARALDHAHRRGVVHRDVKPGNLLLTPEGRVKVADLGLARSELEPSLTREGATLGTPQYLSPEQARDPSSANERSDLFGLGATLYHAATGEPPFSGETAAEVLTKVLFSPVPDPAKAYPSLSLGFCLVLRKALAKDPARRYASARELLEDLERVRAGAPPAVDPRALVEPAPKRRLPALWAIPAVTLVGVVAFVAWQFRDAPLAGEPAGGGVEVSEVAAIRARLEGPAGDPLGALVRARDLLARPGLDPVSARTTASLAERAERALRSRVDRLRGEVQERVREATERRRFADGPALFDRRIPELVRAALGAEVSALPPPWRDEVARLVAAARADFEEASRRAAGAFLPELDRFLAGPLAASLADLERRGAFRTALALFEEESAAFRDASGTGAADLAASDAERARGRVEAERRVLRERVRVESIRRAASVSAALRDAFLRAKEAIEARGRGRGGAAFESEAARLLREKGVVPEELPPGTDPDLLRELSSWTGELAALEGRALAAEAEAALRAVGVEARSKLRERSFAEVATLWRDRLGNPAYAAVADRVAERLEEAEALAAAREAFAREIDARVGKGATIREGGIWTRGTVAAPFDRDRGEVALRGEDGVVRRHPFVRLHPETIERLLGLLDEETGGEPTSPSRDDLLLRSRLRIACGETAGVDALLRRLDDDPRVPRLRAEFEALAAPGSDPATLRERRAAEAVALARALRREGDFEKAREAYARLLREHAGSEVVRAEFDSLRGEAAEVEESAARSHRGTALAEAFAGARVEWAEGRPVLHFSFEGKKAEAWRVPDGYEVVAEGLRRSRQPVASPAGEAEAAVRLEGSGSRARFTFLAPWEEGLPRSVAFRAGRHRFAVEVRSRESQEISHEVVGASRSSRAMATTSSRPLLLGAVHEFEIEYAADGKTVRFLLDGGELLRAPARAGVEEGVGFALEGPGLLRAVRVAGVVEPPRSR